MKCIAPFLSRDWRITLFANTPYLAELMESVESLREQIDKIDKRIEEECDMAKKAALQKIRDELVADYIKALNKNSPSLYPNPLEELGQHVATDIGCAALLRVPGW